LFRVLVLNDETDMMNASMFHQKMLCTHVREDGESQVEMAGTFAETMYENSRGINGKEKQII
jgi:hypothetical protein